MLEPDEQRLFARLSVFPGCTLEAAQAVCDVDIDTLQTLVEKSLLRHTNERFWMLETIREYATERLAASGGAEAIRRRHAEHFLRVAESTCLSTERIGSGPMRYDVALAEQDNMRTALDWALGADPALGLRIAIALEQFWVSKDPFEGMSRLAALLGAAGELPPDVHAGALRVLGGTSTVSGQIQQALQAHHQSLELYERLGDEFGILALRHRLAVSAFIAGDLVGARKTVEENLVRARALDSVQLKAENLSTLANIEVATGNLETALDLFRRHLELARQIGFTWFESIGLANLTEISFRLGRLDEAEEYGRAALGLATGMEDRVLVVTMLALLALVAREKGDAQRAGRLWGAVEAEGEQGSFGWQQGEIDGYGGQILADPNPQGNRK